MNPFPFLVFTFFTVLIISSTPLAFSENEILGKENTDNGFFNWMQESLKNTWKFIENINPFNDVPPSEPEIDISKELEQDITKQEKSIPRPTTIETLTEKAIQDGTITKKFVHGDTEIIYKVGVENGVEETPSPDVLRAMSSSYSEEELKHQKEAIDRIVRDGPQGMGKVIGIKNPDGSDIYIDLNKAWKSTQIHTNNKLKKQYIDTNFTCENYHTLAKKFVGESMYGVGYAGSVENYIYTKALNECIDPKYQEKLDKVYAELEEVNKPNENDPH